MFCVLLVLNRFYVTVVIFFLDWLFCGRCDGGATMVYSLKRKMKILKHVRLGVSSVEEVSKIRKIPKQTIYRWMRQFKIHGLTGLENGKQGNKAVQKLRKIWNSLLCLYGGKELEVFIR